jgi:hypothetical protein
VAIALPEEPTAYLAVFTGLLSELPSRTVAPAKGKREIAFTKVNIAGVTGEMTVLVRPKRWVYRDVTKLNGLNMLQGVSIGQVLREIA